MIKYTKCSLLLVVILITIGINNATAFQNLPINRDYAPSISPDGSKIVFHSRRDGIDNIYKMDADGSNQTKLTSTTYYNQAPKFSPDGSKIIYNSLRDEIWQIYIINSDGTKDKSLTDSEINSIRGSWSHDGSKIYFSSRVNDIRQLWSMNADGSNKQQLTFAKGNRDYPIPSPDGLKIAYTSDETGGRGIYVMDIDGTNPVKLTNSPNDRGIGVNGMAWSPDSKKIAFSSTYGIRGWPLIYIMNADGTELGSISKDVSGYYSPAWSKDGKKIIVDSNRTGLREIYSMNTDGSELKNLTNTSSQNEFPVWADNGKKIVFQSYRDGNADVFIMNEDGSKMKNLTKNKWYDYGISLTPDKMNVAFMSDRAEHHSSNVYTMDIKGRDLKKRSTDKMNDVDNLVPNYASFLPDGKRYVAEIFERDGRKNNFYVLDLNGSILEKLTDHEDGNRNTGPRVSPDGKFIVYQSNRDGNREVYRINADGSNQINLSNNDSDDFSPVWSSDCENIYFISTRNNTRSIYGMAKERRPSLFISNISL